MDPTHTDRVLADLDCWIAVVEEADTPIVRGSQTTDHGPWTMPVMNTALARDLRRILGRIAFWGLLGHFLLVAGVLAGPWQVDAATIALIGGYSTGPIMALGGLLTLMAVMHGIPPAKIDEAIEAAEQVKSPASPRRGSSGVS